MAELSAREQRALVIAARNRLHKKETGWVVPSQSNKGISYKVDPVAKTCSCLDHTEGGFQCKHILAVQYTLEREYSDDGSLMVETESLTVKTAKKTYRQDWRSYNMAQTNEKDKFQMLLRGLCDGVESPKQIGRGCRMIPQDDAIFSAVFKVYSTVSGRRFMSDLRDAKAKGYVKRMPCYNSIFNVLEKEATAPVLQSLIVESANPLKAIETTFACDSSGFSGCRFDKWFDKKWGDFKQQRAWVKAHVMTGVKTNVITSAIAGSERSSDHTNFEPLLACTASRFTVNEVCADLAYSSKKNLGLVETAGALPLIPFKVNTTASQAGIWNKMFHYFHFNREEFLSRYHQRSNVESTFSMLKAKFGDGCRSKTDTAMQNEVLAKILCHNICCLISAMYELGIDPTFWRGEQLAM